MPCDNVDGSIVTGAIGVAVGIVMAGKVIKDISSIKTHDDGSPELNRRWKL